MREGGREALGREGERSTNGSRELGMEGHKGWRFIREGGFMRRKSGGRREEGRVLGGKERSRGS